MRKLTRPTSLLDSKAANDKRKLFFKTRHWNTKEYAVSLLLTFIADTSFTAVYYVSILRDFIAILWLNASIFTVNRRILLLSRVITLSVVENAPTYHALSKDYRICTFVAPWS